MQQTIADLMAMELALLVDAIEHERADIQTGRARRLVRFWQHNDELESCTPPKHIGPCAKHIGPCEWCGIVDHHLDKGLCPQCREKFIDREEHTHA